MSKAEKRIISEISNVNIINLDLII
jgi:hypothetical protein